MIFVWFISIFNMKHLPESLSNILQQFYSQGYVLHENKINNSPNESLQAPDWRLDSVRRIPPGADHSEAYIVVAVSSVYRQSRLLFVESVAANQRFDPMQLMRRLFAVGRNKQ
jgi:hypothetical protein